MQTPNANRWNIGCVGSPAQEFCMYISYCLCQFRLRWTPNAKVISSGIWALLFVPFSDRCPDGSVVVNNKCFVYSANTLDFYAAREACKDQYGGDLAQFDSDIEYNAVVAGM